MKDELCWIKTKRCGFLEYCSNNNLDPNEEIKNFIVIDDLMVASILSTEPILKWYNIFKKYCKKHKVKIHSASLPYKEE